MELILYGIIGCLMGSLIVLITLNLFKSKPSIDYQKLIKQSEERLEKSKKYGEELDRILEEMKKQSGDIGVYTEISVCWFESNWCKFRFDSCPDYKKLKNYDTNIVCIICFVYLYGKKEKITL